MNFQTNILFSSALIRIKSDYNISLLSNLISAVIVEANPYWIGSILIIIALYIWNEQCNNHDIQAFDLFVYPLF